MKSLGDVERLAEQIAAMDLALKRSFSVIKRDIDDIKKEQYHHRKELLQKIENLEESIKELLEDYVRGEQLDTEMKEHVVSQHRFHKKIDDLHQLKRDILIEHKDMEKKSTSFDQINQNLKGLEIELSAIKTTFVTKDFFEKKMKPVIKKAAKKEQWSSKMKKIDKLEKKIDMLKGKKSFKEKTKNLFFAKTK